MQQIRNCGFGDCTACAIVDKLFHTYGHETQLQQTSPRLMISSNPFCPQQAKWNSLQANQIYTNLCPLHISLIQLTATMIEWHHQFRYFWEELLDFYLQNKAHETDWPVFNNFGPECWKNRNITSILWEVQLIPTLQQMVTTSPPSTLLWLTMLHSLPKIMLPWANSWKQTKPWNQTWTPSYRNLIKQAPNELQRMQCNYTPTPFKQFNNWYYCCSSKNDTDHEGYNWPWNKTKTNYDPYVTRCT